MSIEKERKAFEDWYDKAYLNTDIGYLMHNGQYSSRRKQHSWDAWQASANRQGYKLVPAEPTKEMLIAADGCVIDGKVTSNNIYKAMIGAIE